MQTLRRSGTVAVVAVVATTGLAAADAPSSPSPDPRAQHAVAALVSSSTERALAAVPTGFEKVLGYSPAVEGGRVVNPTGSCSSPVPLPGVLDAACREHDYGYDLLRFAHRTGGTLPARARRVLDDHFARAAADACHGTPAGAARARCLRWAEIAAFFVRANSVRQHHSVPAAEDPLSVATGAAGVVGVGAGVAFVLGCLRLCLAGRSRRRVSRGLSTAVSA